MEPVVWFGWFRADIIAEYADLFWRGALMTVAITVICVVQGSVLGLAIGVARLGGYFLGSEGGSAWNHLRYTRA